MAKLRRFHIEGECYHIVTTTRGRAPLFANATNAGVLEEALQFVRRQRAYVLAYAIMPDHLHVVLAPRPGFTISMIRQSIKGFTSRLLNARNGTRGPFWQRSFYDRIIDDEPSLWDVIEYVHNNPVAAGLCEDAEGYQYSSAGKPGAVDLEEFYA